MLMPGTERARNEREGGAAGMEWSEWSCVCLEGCGR